MLSRILISLLIPALWVPQTHACTAFVVYRNGLALAGNNEDFWQTDTKIWFVPKGGSKRGVGGRLGRVYFGFRNFYPQGGMNEAGLFFDGFATSENKIESSLAKPSFEGNLTDHVMANCETVSEVVAEFEKYDLSFLANAMLMFGDQHGDSVIIEGDAFVRIKKDYQVVTNFYQSMTPAGKSPCPRYEAAIRSLEKGDPISVETCRDVLSTTCQKGKAPTQYSNVYDLKKGLVYLYHFHSFGEAVCLNLKQELAKGAHEIDLPSLFPENKDFVTFQKDRKREIRDQTEARTSTKIDPAIFGDFTGKFDFEVSRSRKTGTISLREDRLYLTFDLTGDQDPHEISPEAEDRFFYIGDLGLETYRFQRGDDNRVTGLTLKVFGRTFRGKKQE